MSEQLDLPQTEALLRTHFERLDPGGLRPDVVARIRDGLEASPARRRGTRRLPLRLEPVGSGTVVGRLSLGWSLAAAAVVAILVVGWMALGRLAGPPVAATPSTISSPAASAITGPTASAQTAPASGGVVAPSPSAPTSEQRALAFADRSHGLVVGAYQGQGAVWSTTDEGQTWTATLVQAPPLDSVAVAGTHAWASATCANAIGPIGPCTPAVLASMDGGATWTVISSTAVGSLTFVDQNDGFGVDASTHGATHLLATTDGGVTWAAVTSAEPCESGYYPVGISFPDATHGWVACGADKFALGSSPKEVVATGDGGKTWTVRSRGDAGLAETLPFEGTFHGIEMLASGTGVAWLRTEGLVRTTDGGATWTRLPLGDAGTGLDWPGASVTQDGGLFALTVDGSAANGAATFNLGLGDGRDWKPYVEFARLPAPGTSPTPEPSTPPQPAIARSVAFFDASHGIAIGSDASQGFLWRTADGGRTWTVGRLHTAIAALAATFGDRVWITTSACPGDAQPGDPSCTSTIERSDDRGATWSPIAHLYLRSISFGDSSHGFGVGSGGPAGTVRPGNGGAIYATSDAGATWRPLADPFPCGTYDPVSVSFLSATHGWVACAGGEGAGQGMKGVMETTDGGRTWTWRARVDIPGGLPGIGSIPSSDYVDTISIDAAGAGFMTGLRGSTFRTTDGGRTWISCPPGEFDAFNTSAASIVQGGPWFLIQSGWISGATGAMEAGLMRSDDRGATWARVGPLLPNP